MDRRSQALGYFMLGNLRIGCWVALVIGWWIASLGYGLIGRSVLGCGLNIALSRGVGLRLVTGLSHIIEKGTSIIVRLWSSPRIELLLRRDLVFRQSLVELCELHFLFHLIGRLE